jgi:hypothetical protein
MQEKPESVKIVFVLYLICADCWLQHVQATRKYHVVKVRYDKLGR